MQRGYLQTALAAPLGAAAIGAAWWWRRRSEHRVIAGRTALITGGSRGLGLELARTLARAGCKLILVARDEEELQRAADDIRRLGADVKTIPCDLSHKDQLATMIEAARQAFGTVDILINNAGEITVGPVESLGESEFEAAMDLMFWAGVRITLALLPDMLRSGDADIVNITSVGGKVAVPHLIPYVSAKFAMTGFSEGLQSEMRPRGVHVLTAAPGLLRTGSHLNANFAGNREAEYRWFTLGAAAPGFSMEVSRAAEQIVHALIERKRELILTAQAQLAARLYGAFPECALPALELANRWLLPASEPNPVRGKGRELHSAQPAAFRALTALGAKAASAQNQL